jgi:hypothetical protein
LDKKKAEGSERMEKKTGRGNKGLDKKRKRKRLDGEK